MKRRAESGAGVHGRAARGCWCCFQSLETIRLIRHTTPERSVRRAPRSSPDCRSRHENHSQATTLARRWMKTRVYTRLNSRQNPNAHRSTLDRTHKTCTTCFSFYFESCWLRGRAGSRALASQTAPTAQRRSNFWTLSGIGLTCALYFCAVLRERSTWSSPGGRGRVVNLFLDPLLSVLVPKTPAKLVKTEPTSSIEKRSPDEVPHGTRSFPLKPLERFALGSDGNPPTHEIGNDRCLHNQVGILIFSAFLDTKKPVSTSCRLTLDTWFVDETQFQARVLQWKCHVRTTSFQAGTRIGIGGYFPE